jgi:hypothetical protein
MADLSNLTRNKLHERARSEGLGAGVLLLAAALAIGGLVMAGVAQQGLFALIGLGAGAVVLLQGALGGGSVFGAGAAGEARAVELLAALPDGWTLFNQVDLPDLRRPGRTVEADVIAVGPDAVFVIEVKHNRGTVRGGSADGNWEVEKVGRAGGVYDKTMRNPVRQVKSQVHCLVEFLKARKLRAWVEGVVVFTHSEAEISGVDGGGITVLRARDLVDHLRRFSPPRRGGDAGRVVEALKALRHERQAEAA